MVRLAWLLDGIDQCIHGDSQLDAVAQGCVHPFVEQPFLRRKSPGITLRQHLNHLVNRRLQCLIGDHAIDKPPLLASGSIDHFTCE
jgi:hypothetical protein